MKPALSRTLKWTGIGLAVPVALLGAALGALQVPAVKAFVAAKVSEAVSGPDFTLTLDDLAGGLPFGPRLGRVEIGDASGRWLVLEQASVALDPWALLSGRIHVETVEAARLTVDRLPEGGAETPPSDEPLDLSVPQLSKGLAVDRLAIAEIVLAAPVAGEETRLALTGHLGVDEAGVAGLRLALAPLAGAHAPRLDLEALHRPADDRLTLNLALDEPAGGPLSRIAGLEGTAPIHVALAGEGPLSGFDATIEAAAGGAGLTGRLHLARTATGIAATLTGKTDPGPFLPADFAGLARDGVDLDLAVEMAGKRVDLRRLALAAGGLRLAADGSLVDGREAALNATIDLDPAAELPPLADVPTPFRPGHVALAATALLDEGTLDVSRLAVEMPGASVTGTLGLGDGFDAVTATIDLKLPGLGMVPEAGLSGAADAHVTLNGKLGGPDLGFEVALAGKDIGGTEGAPLPGLLGPSPTLAVAGRYGTDGVAISALALRAAAATLEGSGRFDPATGAVAANLSGAAEDLAALGVTGLSGSARLAATVAGTTALPQIDLTLDGKELAFGGTGFGDPRLVVKAAPDAGAGTSTGRFDLAVGGTRPVTLGADLLFDGAHVAVGAIEGDVLGAKLAGDLRYGLDAGMIDGGLKVTAARLDSLGALLGQRIGGAATVSVALAERDGGQGADVTLDGRGLSASGVTIGRLTAKAVLDDVLGAGRGRAEMTANALAGFDAAVERLNLKATLASFADVDFDLSLAGTAPGAEPVPVTLAAKGDFTAGGAVPRLTLVKLDGTLGETPLGLRRPLVLDLGDSLAAKDIALHFGKAEAKGDLALGAGASGRLTVQGFDFADLAGLMPATDLPGGTLDLDLSLDGNRGRLTLAGRRLAPPASAVDVAAADMPRPDLDLTLQWRRDKAEVDLSVTGIKEATIKARGTVPVRLEGGIPMPNERGALDLAVEVKANLRRLAPLLPLGDNSIRGRLALDARIGGTLAAPEPTGRLTIERGRIANGLSGFELRDLALAIAFTGASATIESLSGTDGEGGTLKGSGSAHQTADGDFALNAAIEARNLRFTRLDIATTAGDVDLSVTGTATAPVVAGKVIVRRGNVEISAKVPPSVAVVEVRDPAASAPADLTARAGTEKRAVGSIDLSVEAPGQFFVRGRGLDSEWRGTIVVKGPLNAPDANGGFEVVRGTYTLAGRPFAISEGTLSFPSGFAAPPQLKVVASAPADDVEAKVSISGPVTALKIELSSEPALPNDEVLSRVLFGRSVSNLTTSQALRLGQTALELSGQGGGSVLGGVRDALGLDRLDIGSDDSAAPTDGSGGALAGTSLSAGRYIADGVYLGFEQGLTPDSGSVNIEVEVYPRVTVEGEIGQTNNSSVGLNYKFDY